MQNNGKSLQPPQSLSKDKNVPDQFATLREENERLAVENDELRKNLQKEKFYHKTLYSQWLDVNNSVTVKQRELEQLRSVQKPNGKVYHYGFYILLILTALLLILNFNLLSNRPVKNEQARVIPVAPNNAGISQDANGSAEGQSSNETISNAGSQKAEQPKSFNPVKDEPVTGMIPTASIIKSPLKYVIKRQSFFHNKPDSSTARNTFVLPSGDAYGTLTAKDDRNGFIYVVFVNHAGRTSKGWIRKSDLEPVK